jgi:hypothetical protein
MAILGVMVVMLFAAFDQASRSWLQAENRVETYTQARAALDYMTRELSQAMVNSNLQFLATTNALAFIAPVNTGTNAVDLMEVVYVLSNSSPFTYSLVRRASAYGSSACMNYGTKPPSSCGGSPWDFYSTTPNPNWPETSDPNRTTDLADNITSLQFTLYDTNGNAFVYWNSTPNPTGTSWGHENPGLPSGIVSPTMLMTNRAPGGVEIQIYAIDARATNRLQSGMSIGAATNIINQAQQSFSTFVSIPGH